MAFISKSINLMQVLGKIDLFIGGIHKDRKSAHDSSIISPQTLERQKRVKGNQIVGLMSDSHNPLSNALKHQRTFSSDICDFTTL